MDIAFAAHRATTWLFSTTNTQTRCWRFYFALRVQREKEIAKKKRKEMRQNGLLIYANTFRCFVARVQWCGADGV